MPKGFDVDLGSAASVFGIGGETPKEVKEESMPEKTVVAAPVNNMTVDSPKELWDVIGHISLSFYVETQEEIVHRVQACTLLWDTLREEYAAELNQATLISDAQKGFLEQLSKDTGEALPEAWDVMGKEEASALITALLAKRGSRERGAPAPAQQQQAPARRDSDGPNITVPQLNFITTLCKRARQPVPADIESYSKAQASDLIKELQGK